ncbi:MAG: FKBP-type peptidyl-prolyl cis-trans isomerase [Thermodesulfobacteriota bacterium]|nr:FKBP-type peptidyl-prolyl cis-trans isomerase [Thermodesulfobacteriota bacterium]
MKVDRDTVVTVNYTVTVKDGETPEDFSRPFNCRFLYGRDRVLPALEKALIGHEQEDEIHVNIPPEQAFGPYNPYLVKKVPISDFNHSGQLKEGEYYEEFGSNGKSIKFYLKELHGDYVLADFNHPSAGKSLVLNGTISEVKAASMLDIMAAMNACSGGG